MATRLTPGSFFGEMRGQRRVADLFLAECAYAPDLRLPTHMHETPFFYFVLQGASTEVTRGASRSAPEQTLVFHPAGEAHSNHWLDVGGRCFHLEIASGWMDRHPEITPFLTRPFETQGGLPVWLATRLHREFLRTDAASALVIEGLTLELLAEAARWGAPAAESRPPRWLRQARDLLHSRFADTLTLDEVAAAVGVHPSHLARVFRQQLHCTVGDYVRRLRIEYSCRQLSSTDTPLVEIALEAGFADQSHFTKTFKRRTGLTPAEFRRHFSHCNAETMRCFLDTRQRRRQRLGFP
jgi:AraC family transcriptional regulator